VRSLEEDRNPPGPDKAAAMLAPSGGWVARGAGKGLPASPELNRTWEELMKSEKAGIDLLASSLDPQNALRAESRTLVKA
jgi:hypothetical protein